MANRLGFGHQLLVLFGKLTVLSGCTFDGRMRVRSRTARLSNLLVGFPSIVGGNQGLNRVPPTLRGFQLAFRIVTPQQPDAGCAVIGLDLLLERVDFPLAKLAAGQQQHLVRLRQLGGIADDVSSFQRLFDLGKLLPSNGHHFGDTLPPSLAMVDFGNDLLEQFTRLGELVVGIGHDGPRVAFDRGWRIDLGCIVGGRLRLGLFQLHGSLGQLCAKLSC